MKLLEEFWKFVTERESIRLRRLRGDSPPWTDDPIMRDYSFTNVKREHDRTTTQLKREFYDDCVGPNTDPRVVLLNCTLFRYHGTIEAAREIGWHDDWTATTRALVIAKISEMRDRGETPFTGAYIVPNAGSTEPKHEIVATIVDHVWKNAEKIVSHTPASGGDADSWAQMTWEMCRLWGVGSFMAKEVLLDFILATGWEPGDWTTWTPVGPGGRRGASWVKYGIRERINENEALEVIREVYATREQFWPEIFDVTTVDGRSIADRVMAVKLDLTDVQFQFCEFDKWMRTKSSAGTADQKFPKRRFRPTSDDITGRVRK